MDILNISKEVPCEYDVLKQAKPVYSKFCNLVLREFILF